MTQLLMDRCKKARPVYAAAIASRNMAKVEEALAAGCNVGFKTVESVAQRNNGNKQNRESDVALAEQCAAGANGALRSAVCADPRVPL